MLVLFLCRFRKWEWLRLRSIHAQSILSRTRFDKIRAIKLEFQTLPVSYSLSPRHRTLSIFGWNNGSIYHRRVCLIGFEIQQSCYEPANSHGINWVTFLFNAVAVRQRILAIRIAIVFPPRKSQSTIEKMPSHYGSPIPNPRHRSVSQNRSRIVSQRRKDEQERRVSSKIPWHFFGLPSSAIFIVH